MAAPRSNHSNLAARIGPSWEDVRRREPELGRIVRDIRALRQELGDAFDGDRLWYGHDNLPSVRDRLSRAVGISRNRGPDWLCTPEAYAAALTPVRRELYSVAPPRPRQRIGRRKRVGSQDTRRAR